MSAFILMGVSGSGKSAVGRCVAESLDLPFFEGDDYHPPENVAKMAQGIALVDDDRVGWIDALMQAVNASEASDVIVACSALTHSVRYRIRSRSRQPIVFLHLTAGPAIIEQRLLGRGQHFMKAGMLPSQLSALQPSTEAIAIDATRPLSEVCATVRAEVANRLTVE